MARHCAECLTMQVESSLDDFVTASLIAKLLSEATSQYLGQGSLEIMDKSIFEPGEPDPQLRHDLQVFFDQYAEPCRQYSVIVLFRKFDDIGPKPWPCPMDILFSPMRW